MAVGLGDTLFAAEHVLDTHSPVLPPVSDFFLSHPLAHFPVLGSVVGLPLGVVEAIARTLNLLPNSHLILVKHSFPCLPPFSPGEQPLRVLSL